MNTTISALDYYDYSRVIAWGNAMTVKHGKKIIGGVRYGKTEGTVELLMLDIMGLPTEVVIVPIDTQLEIVYVRMSPFGVNWHFSYSGDQIEYSAEVFVTPDDPHMSCHSLDLRYMWSRHEVRTPQITINWSAWGSQPAEVAQIFGESLCFAAKLAKWLEAKYSPVAQAEN